MLLFYIQILLEKLLTRCLKVAHREYIMRDVYKTENGQLEIGVIENDHAVIMEWRGKSTSLYPFEFLNPIFDRALTKNKNIIMNFCKVDFLTSTTLTPLVKILETVREGNIHIELEYDSRIEWQTLTFSALSFFTECDRIKITGL